VVVVDTQEAAPVSLPQAFGFGLIGPLLVVFFVAMMSDHFFETLFEYPWHIIFAMGIMASLWAQISVFFFFFFNGYQKVSTYGGRFGQKIDFAVRTLFPLLTALLVTLSLVKIRELGVHISCVLGYLLSVAVLDWLTWRMTKCTTEGQHEAKVSEFKEASRQLLFHIDGAVFLVVVMWVIALWIFPEKSFYFKYELMNGTAPDPSKEHLLRDPLLAGVIGCQMFLTWFLLGAHLLAWKQGRLLSSRGVSTCSQ
jgi:hypothetical protein